MTGRIVRVWLHTLLKHTVSIALTALVLTTGAEAQFRLFISRPVLDEYPRVKLPIQVRDTISRIKQLQVSSFTITENGVNRIPVYLDCNTDSASDPITFLYVMDVSNSMRFEFGTQIWDWEQKKWKAAKTAFKSAVDAMRPGDSGVLYSLSAITYKEWELTSDTQSLKDAIDGLDFRDGTAIYDAIINVLLDTRSIGGRVVMILLTDGSDQMSSYTVNEAISMAKGFAVPVFVIGLDVLPMDEVVLQRIGYETGGAYYYAPSAEELQNAMHTISQSILNSNCILAYDTDDTCKDGRVRTVVVSATIDSSVSTVQTSYQLPFELENIPIILGQDGAEYEDEMIHSIPLSAGGYLNSDQRLKFSVDIEYDPQLLQYSGLDANGIADISGISVVQIDAGKLRITGDTVRLSESIPRGGLKALFSIRFLAVYQSNILNTHFDVSNVRVTQDCPAVTSSRRTDVSITGCPSVVRIGLDSTIVVFVGKDVEIPLRMYSEIDTAQEMQYSFTIRYDTAYIRYRSFQTEGTLSSAAHVAIAESTPGTLYISCTGGFPTGRTGDLLRLSFTGVPHKESYEVSFDMEMNQFAQTCAPAIEQVQASVLLNGLCDKIIRKKGLYLYPSIPNPVTAVQNRRALVHFRIATDGLTRIVVYQADGRPVFEVCNEYKTKGEYLELIDLSELSSGLYMMVLTDGHDYHTQKLLIE